MKQYKFDIAKGHYYVVNEAEGDETEQTGGEKTAMPVAPVLNTEETAEMRAALQKKLDAIDLRVKPIKQYILQCEQKLGQAKDALKTAQETGSSYNISNITNLQRQLINYKIQLEDLAFEKAKITNVENKKILHYQVSLLENMVRSQLPEKYRSLNESNIHTAKVYMKNLIAPDDNHIIKNMHDFKRAFGNSNLLYGKDKEDYYVVCVDQEDFNKMYDTLEEVGYLRDEIIDNIMPQLFDRKDMIK